MTNQDSTEANLIRSSRINFIQPNDCSGIAIRCTSPLAVNTVLRTTDAVIFKRIVVIIRTCTGNRDRR